MALTADMTTLIEMAAANIPEGYSIGIELSQAFIAFSLYKSTEDGDVFIKLEDGESDREDFVQTLANITATAHRSAYLDSLDA